MFNEKETESSVSVTLGANSFNDGTYIARVPRKALDLDNILTDISADYPSLDPFVIAHAAELIKRQILKYIKEGKAVNILEIGTIYPAPKGTVSRANPQGSELPDLELRFRPSKEASSALSAVKPMSFMIKTNEPAISRVISLKGEAEEGKLYRGYPVRITGENLKIAGEAAGVFFVPADAEGAPDADENKWIAADASYLMRNWPKTLEFAISDEAKEQMSYFVAVRTQYCRSGILRKEAVTGFSSETVRVQG